MNRGKRNNQNFAFIAHARFIQIITYKADLGGITLKVPEAASTFKASLLDPDSLPVHTNGDEQYTFSGKRVKRGLYRTQDGRMINADRNGAGNVIRTVAPDAFSKVEGVEDGKAVQASLVVHLVQIVVPRRTQKASHGVSTRSRDREQTL